ncbi:hypothetical protein PHSY_003670 [Pseudozyma hubeiensis SY62]|uniref:Uncharacterized protein n=1 Tax=Pseudozyma hubeiensis (strain SY62) TaxID=1305764 RepID=R9P402_PSEHS|nr:hypothetical protein PHSY_003670 [Pseudozyma hubeiensis SY62]GAC96091.1 hypothetical protein PHSY_003670 [Pseudozyma hubeiensis SY62]
MNVQYFTLTLSCRSLCARPASRDVIVAGSPILRSQGTSNVKFQVPIASVFIGPVLRLLTHSRSLVFYHMSRL